MKRVPLLLHLVIAIAAIVLLAKNARADTFDLSNAALRQGLVGSWALSTTTAKTIWVGDQFTYQFTGTASTINFTTGAGNFPSISVTVDGGTATTYDLTDSQTSQVVATGLADTTHLVSVVYLKAFSDSGGLRWDGTRAFNVSGVVVDSGKTVAAATIPTNGYMFFLGDSTTENYGILNSWCRIIAASYNSKLYQVGLSGQGYEVGPPYYPVFINSYPYFYGTTARSWTPAPRVLTICGGVNGTTTAADVKALLEAVRTSNGAGVWLFQLVPFNLTNQTNITTGFNDYVSAHPSDTYVRLINLGAPGKAIVDNPTYGDGTHLTAAGSPVMAALLGPYYADVMAALDVSAKPGSAALIFAQVITFPSVAKREDEDDLLAA